MKKLFTLFLTLFLIATNAYAEWTHYAKDEIGNISFYDKSTLKRNGNKVKVWNYTNYSPNDEQSKSLNVSSMRSLKEIDCVNETFKTLALSSYSKSDLKGDFTSVRYTSIDYIVPESITADLMKLVCKK